MTSTAKNVVVILISCSVVGCTTTSWAPYEFSSEEEVVDRMRITTIDGEQFDARFVTVSEETVRGVNARNTQFSLNRAEIAAMEKGNQKTDDAKTFGAIVLIPVISVAVLTAFCALACDFGTI